VFLSFVLLIHSFLIDTTRNKQINNPNNKQPTKTKHERTNKQTPANNKQTNKQVGESFGFTGDDGYIHMQMSLLAHANDPTIEYNTARATMAVFYRAGITIPGQ
jgi:hypothetical protein